MGKNWKGPGGGRGGRGGGRGSRGGRGSGGSTNDTSSCKGHGAIMGTCDAARERETSKEMVNLLNQAIEIMCPASVESEINIAPETATSGSGSVKDMLAQEIAQVRKQKHSATQNVMSVDTKVKGIVMIKIMRKDLCALELVKAIFERVREEKEPCSRHVVRIIPLQRVFFPDNNNLSDNVATIVRAAYPGAVFPHFEREVVVETVEDTAEDSNIEFAESAVEESTTVNNLKRDATEMETPTASNENDDTVDVENKRPRIEPPTTSSADLTESTEPEKPIAIEAPSEARPDTAVLEVIAPTFYPPMNYACLFKARSHNIMTRESAQLTISKTVPSFFRPHFKKAKVYPILSNMFGKQLNLTRSPRCVIFGCRAIEDGPNG